MVLYPPDDPYLINVVVLGLPIVVRWYAVCILGGALLAASITARRAARRGYKPDDVWNLLVLGLLLSIACARAYYVAFEWERFKDRPLLDILNPATGGIAIHGAMIGALLAAVIYCWWQRLNLLDWLDLCAPAFLLAQGIGRWGNFMNQEAYGRPTSLPIGVRIDPQHRLPPFDDLLAYPPTTLFHATFLYESLWNLLGAGALFWLAHRHAAGLRRGDLFLLWLGYYSLGRFFIEGLRIDSLCVAAAGGICEGGLRAAQIVSLGLLGLSAALLLWRHRLGFARVPGLGRRVREHGQSDGVRG
jgi:phosphatidylglycerol:prolipoprotein diacylglycerol transferase